MNSINQNPNNYELLSSKVRFKANPAMPSVLMPGAQTQEVELPDMYYMPDDFSKQPKNFKESVKKFDVLGIISEWFEHPLLMLGTCAGISFGLDAFDNSCNKEYEKSIVGKAARLGDKIEKSKAVQNNTSQKVLGGIKKGWKSIKDFAMKSSVISAMVKTPSKPELSMPKEELKHTDYRLVNRFKELSRELCISPDEVEISSRDLRKNINLKKLRLTDEEVKYLKDTYKQKRLYKIPQAEGYIRINLRRIGKTDSEIAEILAKENPLRAMGNEIFKYMGGTTETWEKIMKDQSGESLKYVKEYSKKLEGLWVNKGSVILPWKHQPFANKEGFKGVFNRAHSLAEGAETKTGRFMSKLLQKLHRGFTFGGAKLGVMMFVAPLLVQTMIRTKKADKKEKVGTAVGGVIDSVSWVFTFPLILKAIYAIGGIKNAGMGEAKVAEEERLIKEFNAKATDINNPEHFKSWSVHRAEKRALKKQLKDLRRVKGQSFFTKCLRGISRFGKADLMKIETYRSGKVAEDFARRLPLRIKDFGYSAGRFMVFMMVGMPLIDKLIKKCTSAVFGHEYDEEKERNIKEAKEKQEEYTLKDLKARMLEVQQNKMNPASKSSDAEKVKFQNDYMPESMLAMAEDADKPLEDQSKVIAEQKVNDSAEIQEEISETAETTPAETPVIHDEEKAEQLNKTNPKLKRDNYTYVPSSDNVLNNLTNPAVKVNKYIPAQTGVQLNKVFDNSGLDAAMRRADRAEKRAINVLAGKFGEGA